jgi:CSLREA domain-containing protein
MDAQVSGITSGGTLASGDNNTAGVVVAGTASSIVTFNVANNTMLGTGSVGMSFNDFTISSYSGTVQNNTITHIAGPGTDALQIVSHDPDNTACPCSSAGSANIAVLNNTITGNFQRGIRAQAAFGDATLNINITGNTVHGTDPTPTGSGGLALRAIEVEVGGSGGTTTDNIFLNLESNNAWMDNGNAGYRLLHRAGYTFSLEDLTGSGTDAANISNWIDNVKTNNSNGGAATTLITGAANNFTSHVTTTPPLLFSPGGVESASETQSVFNQLTANWSALPSLEDLLRRDIANPTSVNEPALSDAQLRFMVDAAIARWTATGLSAEQVTAIGRLKFEVADLPGERLAEVTGDLVRIDSDAGGHHWFVDATPLDDVEFGGAVFGSRRYTDHAGAPAGRLDLLTAIEHETGHKLGLADSYAAKDRDSIMYGYLTVGERRVPATGLAANARPGLTGRHFLKLKKAEGSKQKAENSKHHTGAARALTAPLSAETVTANIGTLPAGGSVTITFQVQVNNPPALTLLGPPRVENQGTVSGSNFSNVLTDDLPLLGGAADKTATRIDLFDTSTTLASDVNPSNDGDTVTFTATINETPPQGSVDPTGTVDFIDTSNGNAVICNDVPVSASVATCQVSTLSAGSTHNIRADYSGDGNFEGFPSNILAQVVNACAINPVVTKIADTNDGVCDGDCSLREAIATVCSAPNNNVTFNLGAGPHTLTALSTLVIAKNVNITNTLSGTNGPLTVTANGGNFRVFRIDSPVTTASLSNFTVTGAIATGASGGGLLVQNGTATLTGMLFTGNTVINGGGGGLAVTTGATLNLRNSTVSGNSATFGGGIYNNGGTLNLLNVTVTNNNADGNIGGGPVGGPGAVGGGIDTGSGLATNIKNSIVAANFATTGTNISGTATDQGNNILTGDPMISALADNGGATRTHALLPTSPAVDAGDNTAADAIPLTTDQRGAGFPRKADSADPDTTQTVDIGAFELHPSVENIGNQNTTEDTPINFNFNIGDDTGTLITGGGGSVTATSSNTTLVPNANLSVTDPAPPGGGARNLSITPAANQSGTTTITVTVTATNGRTATDTFDLNVTAANDNPTLTNNTGLTVNEASIANIINNTKLKVDDVDNAPAQLTFTVGTAPTNGTLKNNGVGLSGGGTFTQDDINNNLLTYDHNGSETTSDSFTFTVSDGAGGSISTTTFNITVTPQNDAPTLGNNTGTTVNEGSTGNVIDSAKLSVNDVDNSPVQLTYTVGTAPANGTLKKSGVGLAGGGTFTQLDINNNQLTYDHNGTETTSDSFSFTVSDGAGGSIGSNTFNITVTPQNDGPTVTATGANLAYAEGDPATAVDTGLTVTDSDSANLTGASASITANFQSGQDALGWVDNNPADNITLDGSSTAQTIVLTGTDTPANYQAALRAITYQNSSEDPSTLTRTVTFTANDGTTTGQGTRNIGVSKVNDNPTLTTNAGLTVVNAGTGTIGTTKLKVDDVDNGAPQLTFTVGTATTNGTLKKGVATLSAGGTFTQADIDGNQITYTHNGTATFTDSFTFTVSDGAGGSIASTTFNITIGNPNVSVNDAKVAEPVSPNTTNMIFTVALAAPAGGSGASVDFTTADEPAGPGKAVAGTCGSGGDYTPTSGQVNFAAGQQVKTISVPVCSDGIVEPDETFLLNLSNAVNATLADAQAVGTITTANPAGTLLISEFRQFGPGPGNDPLDDFVEIYNNTDAPITVPAGGYGLFRMPSTCSAADQPQLIGTIPAGVIIPARGHFLFTGPEVNYTLKDYGSTNGGKHNALLTADLGANENFGLFATANVAQISSVNRFDAVGFGANNQNACDLLREGSTLNPLTSNLTLLGQHSFARKICDWVQGSGCTAVPSGSPKDTNQNSVDFRFSDANTTNAGSGQNLGAPGPERAADPGPPNIPGSPIKRDASPGNSGMNVFVLDTSVGAAVGPNRVRNTGDPAGTYGTMTLRYRVFNNTGAPITRLRYRVIDISTAPQPPGIADLRALTGGDVTVSGVNDPVTCNGAAPCMVLVRGTTLETPPAQPNNGGYNSTLSSGTVTLLTPLANGASIPISFVLGVQQTGTFRFYIIVEALP